MAARRLVMKNIRELFRLRLEAGLSQRRVARVLGCGRSTLYEYEKKALTAGIKEFHQIKDLSDEQLLNLLGLKSDLSLQQVKSKRPLPDWNEIHQELSKKHVTLSLLWTEYKGEHSCGYQYTQFCELYRRWSEKLSVSMRQSHKAGEKVFVDYGGTPLEVVDSRTGEILRAELFVGVLGRSSYMYVEATWTQGLSDWLMSHRRMFEFFGGVPQIVVPDNLRSGVTKPDRYEAVVNRSYEELCDYYGSCVIPSRVGRPRDKAKVESGVLLASRWILASLRDRRFFSLYEANEAIRVCLERINNRRMRHFGKSRRELFEQIDRPVLGRLPVRPYELAFWKRATVNIDHHIVFEDHFYSVPYHLVKRGVEIRATERLLEIFFRNIRVASHRRSFSRGGYSTETSHRPPSHQKHLEWSPERIINWGRQKGKNTGLFIKLLIESKKHPEQGYRSALGVIRLARKYGEDRLNLACGNAIAIGAIKYQTVKNILKNRMEKANVKKTEKQQQSFFTSNTNVRGKDCYR